MCVFIVSVIVGMRVVRWCLFFACVVLRQEVTLCIPALHMVVNAGMQNASGKELYHVHRDWMDASSYLPERDPRLGAGRLFNTTANAAWEPMYSSPFEYLQVRFPGPTHLSRLIMQGSEIEDGGQLLSFKVHSSMDGYLWKPYTNYDHDVVFNCIFNTTKDAIIFNQTVDQTLHPGVIHAGFPLRAQYFRIVPQSWYKKISVRVEYERTIICGDGFKDFLEGCDDTNRASGDGCTGYDGQHVGTPLGPCEIETETIMTDLSGVRKFVTGMALSSAAAQTYNIKKLSLQCNPSSGCGKCTQLYTTFPKVSQDSATLETYQDPNYIQFCPGQNPAGFINPDDPADISVTRNDLGQKYRTMDVRASTDSNGFHGQDLRLYTDFD